jgi:hypothetical protein
MARNIFLGLEIFFRLRNIFLGLEIFCFSNGRVGWE